ncbi:uncharacterized protein LOC122277043 [Carya illinoinensis]|uniref:uncharacterized protein LOC122277043 n=1 Tax=Carya illinoinensis TaxID=32201 RepID=UPI001C71CC31|nr:uncharacterized protein LOC122277043 [Carya illinoinensis]
MEADGQSSRRRGNSQRRKFIRRDHVQGHERLFRDYFAENPVYPSNLFRRRFRMSRPLFLRILNEVESYDPYFVQRRDNAGRLGLSCMQKITAALRMLAYGVTGDFMDEYIRIGKSTAMESLKKFSETLVNNEDSQECWEALIACIGSGKIVPQLGNTIPSSCGNKKKNFVKVQESARKDVERAFGVLQQRFAIIRGPSRMFKVKELTNIMKTCVILHNMIIEDERDDSECLNIEYDQLDDNLPELSRNHTTELTDFIQRHHDIRDSSAHHQLQEDLIEHQWLLHSQH